MTVVYVLFAILAFILFIDFKKGVLIYAPTKLFFNMNVRFGAFTFDLAFSALVLLLFLIKRKKLQDSQFPMSKYFLWYSVGYSLTCLYPDFEPSMIPRILVIVLAFSYVYFYCLQTKNDIKFAILSYAVFAVVMCINGLLESIMHINPLDEFSQSISDVDNSLFLDNEWVRMGQVRYRSFIPHAISYGVACCVIFYALIWHYLSVKENSSLRFIVLGAMALLLSGMIICGSRTPILGLLPLVYIFFDKKIVSAKIRWKLLLLIFVFLLIEGDYVWYSIDSILNSKVAEDAGGSSTDLRLTQYTLALGWMLEDPFFGKGMDFDAYGVNSSILGGESVWIPLMMNNGIVGVISYAYVFWGIYKVFSKSTGKVFLLVFSLGWLIMRTATSLIGVTDAQFFTCMFIIYRYYQVNKSSIKENEVICNNTDIQCRALH